MCVNENLIKFMLILQPTHLILHEEENLIKDAKRLLPKTGQKP